MVECCKKCLGSVQLDKINHCFPFIYFLFISRERTRNFASNVLCVTGEKCMDVEKNVGRKNFFQLLGLQARSSQRRADWLCSRARENYYVTLTRHA